MSEHEVEEQRAIPVRALRSGKDEPLPERRVVRAGPLTAVVENGDLRYVKVGDEEIVRRLYVAVRDRNWDTIEPRFTSYHVDANDLAFVVHFTAEHVRGEIDFAWEGRIEGTSAGVVTCSMEGVARSTFLKNRMGFCVLHPMDLAGTPVEVETADGIVRGKFPERISPHQPFVDIRAIRHRTFEGAEVEFRFDGDLFEMEDQRNWTDASYKTYCTPLRLPYPVEIREGERIEQTVTITVRAASALAATEPGGDVVDVRVGAEAVAVLPAVGLSAASHGAPLSDDDLGRLRALRPAHLRVTLDLEHVGWSDRLVQVAGEARTVGAGLEIEVIAGEAGEGLDDLARALPCVGAEVARVLVFPRSELVTTEPVAARARDALRGAGLDVPIGGGSRAYFTELNRATLPVGLMDVVGFSVNPQVHAFDNASLVETLEAQATTVESARAIVGHTPLAVGPVTLRPRFNPNATEPEPKPAPGELPPSVDPRQSSLFGAGWTVGSIRHLATAGANSLTYYETTGWRGVLERSDHLLRVAAFHSRPGMLFPLYHVLADVAEFAGGEVLSVAVTDPLAIEALAMRSGDRVMVLVASFVDGPTTPTVVLPRLNEVRVRLLDESTAEEAGTDGEGFRRRVDRELGAVEGPVTLELHPFAVARIDGRA